MNIYYIIDAQKYAIGLKIRICKITFLNRNNLLANNAEDNTIKSKKELEITLSLRFFLTILYTAIVIFSYILMFILMTYNMGIILVVILGNTLGYLIFFNEQEVLKDTAVY